MEDSLHFFFPLEEEGHLFTQSSYEPINIPRHEYMNEVKKEQKRRMGLLISRCLGSGRTFPCSQHRLKESEWWGVGRVKERDLSLTKSRDGVVSVGWGDGKKNESLNWR